MGNIAEEESTPPSLQTLILSRILSEEKFCRRTIPHVKPEYFEGEHRSVYELGLEFIQKYNKLPTPTVLDIEFRKSPKADERGAVDALRLIRDLGRVDEPTGDDHQWLLDSTEKWCKERAVFLAIMEAITIIDGKSRDSKGEGMIPEILTQALSVSFDTNVGHDYLEDADKRYEFYHTPDNRIPFSLEMFNKITKGGIKRKTLNIILAGCVHPETKVKLRYRKFPFRGIFTSTASISTIEELLDLGCEVEVESPDGWVRVSDFVDKGEWDEYVLSIDGVDRVRCNENHLFETPSGWKYAKDLVDNSETFLTDKGLETGIIRKTGERIPIVDIQVRHKNQRYYTNGVSSHNTAVGKSMAMCDLAADDLMMGRNVLYITMEMSEEAVAERIDANLMDTNCDAIPGLSRESFSSKIAKMKAKTQGRLMIKEFPTGSAHCGHFRALLGELRMKKNFVPDIIYIDYLNICSSSRIRGLSNSVNTYSLVKSIAEEIRGLAVEFNVPIWSATQVNRAGFNDTDFGLTETSESWGLPGTADLMIALISTEQLESMNQLMVKQLKNRYNNSNENKRFMVGIDRGKMRMFDLDDPTANIVNDTNTKGGSSAAPVRSTPFSSGVASKAEKFKGFKV